MQLGAAWLDSVRPSAFEAVDGMARGCGRADLARLHQGKTWFRSLAPPLAPWTRDEFPLLAHEHAPPGGVPALRAAAAEYLKTRHEIATDADDIVVAGGASHAVFTALATVLEPGDEVMMLSPQWLFATGLVRAARGCPVEVPVFTRPGGPDPDRLAAALTGAVTPRTRAIYVNTPNNPTGVTLDRAALAAVVGLAERHDLWLVADNAYENFVFDAEGFVDPRTIDGAAARTFSVYTLSKTFAMPGYRVGFVVPPTGLTSRLVAAGLYSLYAVSTIGQRAAHAALSTPAAELDDRRRFAAAAAEDVNARLAPPHPPVSGGLYAFLDVRGWNGCTDDAVAAERFVRRCVDAGVTLSPGVAFGEHTAGWVRLCFTAAPPDVVGPAVGTVNAVWSEGAP